MNNFEMPNKNFDKSKGIFVSQVTMNHLKNTYYYENHMIKINARCIQSYLEKFSHLFDLW